MLSAGFAQRCITPPPGLEIPGLFERRIALGTNDDLYARAAVCEDGASCMALVQVDAIFVPEPVVRTARKLARRLCGIREKDCLIAATHTHSGGPLFGGFLSEPDPDYSAFVAQQIAVAIAEARRRRTPCLSGVGGAAAEGVAFNRRFLMRDGGTRTHPGKMHPEIVRPAGPEDPRVSVIGFCDPESLKPLGCVVNFACHATHMNGFLYSADYPRWIAETLQGIYGREFGVVFLNGACGDVTQMDNRNPRPNEFGPYWSERTGRSVGAAAAQALARMDYARGNTLSRNTAIVSGAVRPISAADLKRAKALLGRKAVSAADVETIYARELRLVAAMRPRVRALEIMGVRVGEALLWGVPGEFFQEFALAVREASPFAFTCCVELANGYEGYLCTPESFSGGGYEIRTARSSFLEAGAGPRVVRAAIRLCRRMHGEAERELESLPGRRVWPAVKDSALDGINQLSGTGKTPR